nr:nitrogenase component 1 [uncultured Desulfobacter sp.]
MGFPIHDRIGGSRILHVGYKGALQLFDNIVNTILTVKQTESRIGYAYM